MSLESAVAVLDAKMASIRDSIVDLGDRVDQKQCKK